MSTDSERRLTSLQIAVLRVFWEHGEATVSDVQRYIDSSKPLAATTVATLLKRLETRGVLARRKEGRQYVYRALVDADAVGRSMASGLVDDVYAGRVPGLFAHLFEERSISAEDIAEMKRLIRKAEKG